MDVPRPAMAEAQVRAPLSLDERQVGTTKKQIYRVECDFCRKVHDDDEIDGMLSVQTALGPNSSRKLMQEMQLGKAPTNQVSGEFCDLTCLKNWAELPTSEILRRVEEAEAKAHEGHGHPLVEDIIGEARGGATPYL